jgi:hypothetical protein
MKKIATLTALLAMAHLLTGCASSGGAGHPTALPGNPGEAIQAALFPELKLITTDGNSYRCKLIRLKDDVVTLRPYPYWQIPEAEVPVASFHQVELLDPKSHAGGGFMTGFSAVFLPIGLIGIASSKYNTQFSAALAGSAALGLVGGLVGLVIGAVGDAASDQKIKLYELTEAQKRHAVLKLMGRAGSRP